MSSHPKIAIVMATYEPDPDFFYKQVGSLKNQTYPHWHCWIVDDASSATGVAVITESIANDPRFELIRNEKNLGSVRNFEKGLSQVGDHFAYIALCDQDDVWHSQKLATLLEEFNSAGPTVKLIHSDLRLIDSHDKVLADSCWNTEKRNVLKRFGRLAGAEKVNDLILANVVTGCSAIFRRDLLDVALPFNYSNEGNKPPYHHDQWLAGCALLTGMVLAYPTCLIDYRQHDKNVVGAAKQRTLKAFIREVFGKLPSLRKRAQEALNNRRRLARDLQMRFQDERLGLWASRKELTAFCCKSFITYRHLWRNYVQILIGLF